MDKKWKTKWVKALRSGEYKQAKGALRTKSGAMCCLGVLAHIQGCPIKKLMDKNIDHDKPPRGFRAGLRTKQTDRLVNMNDGERDFWTDKLAARRKSFAEIADYIESKL